MAKMALFRTLAILFLQVQGALTSDALVRSEASTGSLSRGSRVLGPGGPGGPTGLQLSEGAQTKSRPKRCTCYSYRDKECVYYCHLDIIWINTPERTVPYGMSSYQGHQRIRRSGVGQPTEPARCICVHDTDPECQDFCLPSPVKTAPPRSPYRVAGPG